MDLPYKVTSLPNLSRYFYYLGMGCSGINSTYSFTAYLGTYMVHHPKLGSVFGGRYDYLIRLRSNYQGTDAAAAAVAVTTAAAVGGRATSYVALYLEPSA